jgi:HEAT repeat protein
LIQAEYRHIVSLKPILNAKLEDSRRNAALLLGKIQDPASIQALKDRLAIEKEYQVQEQIKKSLKALGA